jgi:hypothetical protein
MSDNAPTVGGDVSVLPSDANGMTEAQVMEGIEGLLDDRQPKKRQPPRTLETRPLPGDRAAETEQGSQDPMPGPEDPATREEEEDEPYEPDLDPAEEGEDGSDHQGIEPPSSWNKQDREVFSTLSPEAQAIVARRDSEQNAAFRQKTQEIAEHRKALESTFLTVQQEREAYANNLQQLLFVAAPEAEEFSQIDWQRLAQEQPADYVRLTAKRDALRGRIGGIQQELQRVAAQSQQAQAYQFHETVRAEHQRLVEALPEFADPEKGPRKIAEMRQWLTQKGFNDQEISQVVDHRVLLVVDEAMQADRARRVRRQAETKRTNGQTPVQPPGAPRQRGDTQAAQRRAQRMDALKRSGSEKDAIGYLMEIL